MLLLQKHLIDANEAEVESGQMRRKFTRDEYHAMDTSGIFASDERTELIDGEVYVRMSPIGFPHIYCLNTLLKLLQATDSSESTTICGSPAVVSDLSEPEPDLMILKGELANYSKVPTMRDINLVVEISDSTLGFDLTNKHLVYGAATIPEYWVVNLRARAIVVHRDPTSRDGYQSVLTFAENETVTPLCRPGSAIDVAAIMPKALP